MSAEQSSPAMPDTDYNRTLRFGVWVLLVGFGAFLLWAALAPIDEAVPAQAVVSVESKRKRIDHLNGGIVEKILVQEGERVRNGQELVVLNETQAKATMNATLSQWRIAKATEARLLAEQQGLKSVPRPEALAASADDPEVERAMHAQEEVFRARRKALESDLAVIQESVRGLESQMRGLGQLRAAREKQVALFEEQIAGFRNLQRSGFLSKNGLLEAERQLSDVRSKQGEDLANIASIQAKLAEFRLRAGQRQAEYRKEVEALRAEVLKEASTLSEKLGAERDTHSRLVIRAPLAGTVVDLSVFTVGGVIKGGERLMDIVPDTDDLILESRLAPQYVDRVRTGLPANLHFDAYVNRAERPVIEGKVVVVSADALADPKTGESYYSMRIAVPPEERERLGALKLQPGMQATAMVKTGERPLLVYLVRPLLRRFTGALGES